MSYKKGHVSFWKGKKMPMATRIKLSKAHIGLQLGKNHPKWKGGRLQAGKGYIKIWCKGHPNAVGNYILEHRLVFSKYLKRSLRKGEFIHHRNGNKSDNRLVNLQLVTGVNHKGELTCPYCSKSFLVR
jgi:hypothetical protein